MEYVFRDVVGYGDILSITSCGKLYSKRSNRFLKLTKNKQGYYQHTTKIGGRNGNTKAFKIHREVAKAFIANIDSKPCVNHIDCNKLNNHHTNLEWCTYKENMVHAFKNNLITIHNRDTNHRSKLTISDCEFIRLNYKPRDRFFGCRALARKYNVSHETVREILGTKKKQKS